MVSGGSSPCARHIIHRGRSMHKALLIPALGAVLFAPVLAQAKYQPKKPEPWAKMTLKEKHAYLHKLKGNSWGIVKHGNKPANRRWHRKAMKRIMRQMNKVHRRLAALKRARVWRSGLPPHYSAWLCIHSHEGSWTDTGDPYWGGLQMDQNFMNAYAPPHLLRRGWANTWSPLEQMWVAENAYRTRGFYPWPNTARMCGLI